MIIIELAGGLGNQLFQYALGRKLALKNSDALKLDIGNYTTRDLSRTYKLGHFRISAETASLEEVGRFRKPPTLAARIIRAFRFRILKEESVSFKPRLLSKTGDMYLEGFWQSEKYFSDIADIIRKDLALKDPMGQKAQEIERIILAEKSPISLHVRRGDYVANPNINAMFGTCSPEYYRKAMGIISERAAAPRYFVFSDDIPWARENLGMPAGTVFVSDPAAIGDYEEVVLMSKCKNHIIANSSFSWWGAWLDPNPEKIVIAPSRWFQGSPKVYKDIVPETWIKI